MRKTLLLIIGLIIISTILIGILSTGCSSVGEKPVTTGGVVTPGITTKIIAASDSSDESKKQAEYVCDGTDDQVEIQAAIESLPAVGGKIVLLEGHYYKDNSNGIALPSNTQVELIKGAVINLRKLDADGCIFTNKTKMGDGDRDIVILGEGILSGNSHSSNGGEQYAVDFENVHGGLIELFIDNFRSIDARCKNCTEVVVRNLRRELAAKDPVRTLMQFTVNESADYQSFISRGPEGSVGWGITAEDKMDGDSSLKLICQKNSIGGILYRLPKQVDIRYKAISFWFRLDVPDEALGPHGISYSLQVKLHSATGGDTISAMGTWMMQTNKWVRVVSYTTSFQHLEVRRDNIDRISISIYGHNLGDFAGPLIAYIDQLQLIPIPIECRGGAVAFSPDDGYADWEDMDRILCEYGWKGNFNLLGSTPYLHDVIPFAQKLVARGSEFSSHSYTHNVHDDNLWVELIKSKESLQKFGLGDINFFAVPGGASEWTADMQAKALEVYRLVRTTTSEIFTKSTSRTILPFSTIDIGRLNLSIETLGYYLINQLKNYEPVALYFHQLTSIGMTEARFREICEWLNDRGIPVVTYSEMFPADVFPDPDWRAAKERHHIE